VVVPEVEDRMVEASGAVAAEAHYVSVAPRLEGRGLRGARAGQDPN